jgi:hypothetical protein
MPRAVDLQVVIAILDGAPNSPLTVLSPAPMGASVCQIAWSPGCWRACSSVSMTRQTCIGDPAFEAPHGLRVALPSPSLRRK